MKVEIQDISDVEKVMRIVLDTDELSQERKKTVNQLQKKVEIKGFRRGKVPFAIIEKNYGDRVDYELSERLLQTYSGKALKDAGYVPVVQPEVTDLKHEKEAGFRFEMKVSLRPTVVLDETVYRGLPLKKAPIVADDTEIDAAIDQMRSSFAELDPVSDGTSIASRDKTEAPLVAVIDFAGTRNGVPFSGGSAEGQLVEIGAGRFLPDFESQLHGMKIGDEKTFDLTFPTDYAAEELRGQTVQFKVKLVDLKQKRLPNLDDDFAVDCGSENLQALREKVRARLVEQKEAEARGPLYEAIIDQLTSRVTFNVPQALVLREQEMGKRTEEEAIKRLRGDFILETIAMREKLEVEPQDFERKIVELSHVYGRPPQEVLKEFMDRKMMPYLQFRILAEKALAHVLDHAVVSA